MQDKINLSKDLKFVKNSFKKGWLSLKGAGSAHLCSWDCISFGCRGFIQRYFQFLIPWIIISRAGLGNPAAIHLYLTQF